MNSTYPDTFARGILNEQYISDDLPDTALFTDFRDTERQDGYNELSINWIDDECAIIILSSQLNKDKTDKLYKNGIGIFSTKELTRICKLPYYGNDVSYERFPLDENKYHGNILLKKDTSKKRKNMIAATIATMCFMKIISDGKQSGGGIL
jgi:hypothetical protein